MFENLPVAVVTQLERLGQALVELSAAQRDGTLAALEQGTLSAVRAALPCLFAAVLHESTTSLQPGGARTRACPRCAARRPVQSWRPRQVTTICGVLTVERPWYHCAACRHGWSPADAVWELGTRTRISASLADWLVDLGATTSFLDAQRELGQLTGLKLAAETIRQYTDKRGMALEEQHAQARAQVARTGEAAAPLDPAPGTLVVETDGVMVRYRQTGWHEVKLGVIGGQITSRLTAHSCVAAREGPTAFGARLLTEAARRGALDIVSWDGPVGDPGLAQLRSVVILGDGAP